MVPTSFDYLEPRWARIGHERAAVAYIPMVRYIVDIL
jgi:hypothetical protein